MKILSPYLLLILFLYSCAPTRSLSSGEQLFESVKIQFAKPNRISNKKVLKEELSGMVHPPLNSRFKLWIYHLVKEPQKQKGFKYWLKYRIGEPPVLFDYALADRNRLLIEKYLHEIGYLNAMVSLDTINQPNKVKAIYEVTTDKVYRIKQVFLPNSPLVLGQLMLENQRQSFLKKGQVYKAENLRLERSRLTMIATQNGYFGLNENDFYFYIDTLGHGNNLDIYVKFRPTVDSSHLNKYFLGRTILYPDKSLRNSSNKLPDTISYKNLTIIENTHFFKQRFLRSVVKGQTNELYNGRLQLSNLSYLQNLDVFKFINLKVEKRQVGNQYFVDRFFSLTPTSFKDARFDFEANTRSGNYLGVEAAANFANKNWLGGAEHLDINLSIGGETQMGNSSNFINTLEVTAGISVAIPRLLLPYPSQKLYQEYVARTRISLSNNYQIRTGFFTYNRLSAHMSYDWRSNRKFRNVWTPILITHNQTIQIAQSFQEQLNSNLPLKHSLENTLILGGRYQLTYSNQDIDKIQPYFFLSTSIELAGNIPSLVARAFTAKEGPYRIFGTPFSQFIKFYADARYYRQRRTQALAYRLFIGFVAPYGNAIVAPYSEQFFIGGSTSLRAFYLRALGPGSYVNPSSTAINFFDQTGNIKLEFNTEYRFDLASYFKGAIFMDAGNIWLLNQSLGSREEGQFKFNTFYKEIAVGTGIGLRVDFDYFVIRLDAAFPIRKPIINQGFKWTLNQLDFLDGRWRSENLVWHLAIGYPF